MCKKSEESVDHLLLHCEVASALWNYIFTLFGIEWVMPRRILDLLKSWGGSFGYGLVKETWRLALLCEMWCIWREKNTDI
jgi:hypothetical protein